MKAKLLTACALVAVQCVTPGPAQSQSPGPGSYFSISGPRNTAIPRAIRLINYLYARGVAPQPVAFADNVDCEGSVGLVDVVYLVNYALRGGPAPCDWFGWYRDPSDSQDAQAIAMWDANDVTGPPALVERVQNDLSRLRTTPGAEQIALGSLHFTPRWMPSRISLMIDSVTYAAIQQGLYHAWDSLNSLYEARQGEFYFFEASGPYFLTMFFNGIKNSVLLARMYGALPGILSAQEEGYIWLGANPIPDVIYPLVQGDTNTYLFQMSWEFAGTFRRHRYWYGMALPDTAWIVGDWDPRLQPQPAWWDQAVANMERYWYE